MTETEKETLCKRIDELCAELSRTQLNRDMWLTRAKVTLKNLTSARAENAKLRELANGYEALTATLCNERGCDGCPFDDTEQIVCEHMRLQTCLAELEIEVPQSE